MSLTPDSGNSFHSDNAPVRGDGYRFTAEHERGCDALFYGDVNLAPLPASGEALDAQNKLRQSLLSYATSTEEDANRQRWGAIIPIAMGEPALVSVGDESNKVCMLPFLAVSGLPLPAEAAPGISPSVRRGKAIRFGLFFPEGEKFYIGELAGEAVTAKSANGWGIGVDVAACLRFLVLAKRLAVVNSAVIVEIREFLRALPTRATKSFPELRRQIGDEGLEDVREAVLGNADSLLDVLAHYEVSIDDKELTSAIEAKRIDTGVIAIERKNMFEDRTCLTRRVTRPYRETFSLMSTFKWRVRELVKGFSNCCQQNPEVLQTAAALSVSIDKLRAYDPLRTKSFAAAFLEKMKALETVLNDNLNRGFPLSPFEGVARRRNLALQHQSKALEHALGLDRGYLTDTKSAGAVFKTGIRDLVGIQSGLAQTDDALDWAERYYRSDCDNQERYVAVREARAEVRAVLAEFHKEMRSSCPGLFEIVPPEKRE